MEINNLLNTSLFGLTISIIMFTIGLRISKKFKSPLLNPLLVAGILIIGFLELFKIDLATYNKGGDMIKFFIAPGTVALAIPLYKNIDLLKKRLGPIFIGIFTGAVAGILSIILLGKLLNIDPSIIKSLLPKSTTAAIGLTIAEYNQGIVELTAVFIVFTGVFGIMIVDKIYQIFSIEDDIAKGIALGATSHVMGTSKALEMGETEGAFASVGLSIAGVLTVILVPYLLKLFLL